MPLVPSTFRIGLVFGENFAPVSVFECELPSEEEMREALSFLVGGFWPESDGSACADGWWGDFSSLDEMKTAVATAQPTQAEANARRFWFFMQ